MEGASVVLLISFTATVIQAGFLMEMEQRPCLH